MVLIIPAPTSRTEAKHIIELDGLIGADQLPIHTNPALDADIIQPEVMIIVYRLRPERGPMYWEAESIKVIGFLTPIYTDPSLAYLNRSESRLREVVLNPASAPLWIQGIVRTYAPRIRLVSTDR